MKKGSRLLVSGCLLGLECNYKNQASSVSQERPDFWQKVCKDFFVIPVCPEQAGGLPTPRIPSELAGSAKDIFGGKKCVHDKNGKDVSLNFIKGAKEALHLARLFNVDFAVLKTRSPSCGKKEIYDGTFSGTLVPGSGMTAFLLKESGIEVLDELEFIELISCTL